MKGFLVLLVLSAGGLAGVLYFRQSLEARRAPAVAAAGQPGKEGKERRRRKRRGARRLARNEAFVASRPSGEAPSGEAPSGEVPSGEVPSGEAPSGEGPPPGVYTPPPSEDRAPLAPGGAETTEAPPSDVFGALSPPSAPAAAGGSRPSIAEPPPVKLRAGDLKMVWQGEDLSRTETTRLDLSNDSGGHDLSEDEIDGRFRTKEDAVLACVARARPDDYTFIPGRINVRFRIQRTGTVKGVQVEAPVILQRGGLTGCIKGVLGSLRFPASNMGQVITFPFSLM